MEYFESSSTCTLYVYFVVVECGRVDSHGVVGSLAAFLLLGTFESLESLTISRSHSLIRCHQQSIMLTLCIFAYSYVIGGRRSLFDWLRKYNPTSDSGNKLFLSDAKISAIFVSLSTLRKVSRPEKR